MNGIVGVALVLAAGAAAQWLAWRTRVPAILLLLGTGLAIGPGFGLLDVDALLGDHLETIVGLSVAVILFEGGLGLRWRDVRGHGRAVARLVTVGVAVTALVGTVAAVTLLGMPLDLAFLLGAVLTVSGPTVVLPLLLHVRPDRETSAVLRWEGILVDPIGAVLAVLAFEMVLTGGGTQGAGVAIEGLLRAALFGSVIGLAGGFLVAVLEGRFLVPDALGAGVGLAAVVLAFAVADLVQPESGLVAVTVMGVFLANQKLADIRHILDFKEDLSQILLGILFILLAARVTREDILSVDHWALAFVAALVLVARPLAVAASTWGTGLSWRQRTFLAWMAPRGIVAAAVSAFFAIRLEAAGRPEGAILAPLTFLTIVATVVLYGLTARPVARLLGVAGPQPQGVLIVGANSVARALARPLQEAGIRILMVDTNGESVAAASTDGLPAIRGDAMDARFEERHGIEGLGSLWAITPNRTTNALAAVRFAEDFGRGLVFQIAVRPDADLEAHLRGRLLWDGRLTYGQMRDRLREGWRITKTPLTERFDLDAWRVEHGERAVALYRIDREARVLVFAEDEPFHASPGDTLIGLTPPRRAPEEPRPADTAP